MSCTRTLPSVSDEVTPAASTSSAGGADPGAFDDFSSNAMATAGASSVDMAMSVADFLDRFRGAGFAATARLFAVGRRDRFAFEATVFRDGVVMACSNQGEWAAVNIRERSGRDWPLLAVQVPASEAAFSTSDPCLRSTRTATTRALSATMDAAARHVDLRNAPQGPRQLQGVNCCPDGSCVHVTPPRVEGRSSDIAGISYTGRIPWGVAGFHLKAPASTCSDCLAVRGAGHHSGWRDHRRVNTT